MKPKFLLLFLSLTWGLTGFTQHLQHDPISNLHYLIKKGTPEGVIVILIHGYGSNENDLFSLATQFPPATTVISVRGPIQYKPNSFSWYDIEFKENGTKKRDLQQASDSHTLLLTFIESMRETLDACGQKMVVGGFSQGAIMSVRIALQHPAAVDGIIGFSGALLPGDLAANPKIKTAYPNIKAFYAHGTEDDLLTIQHGRACKNALQKAGTQLTYKEYPIKHQISQQELGDMVQWFTQHF